MKHFFVRSLVALTFVANFLPLSASNLTLDEARNIANDYYSSLAVIMNNPYDAKGVERMIHLIDLVGVDRNGHPLGQEFRVPNDLSLIGQGDVSNLQVLPLPTFINKLRDVANDSKISLEYTIKTVEFVSNVDLNKGMSTNDFIEVETVKKYQKADGKSIALKEVIILNTKNRSFSVVFNESLGNGGGETVDEMIARATYLYKHHRYEQAFKMFEQVMTADPKNEYASYSLGVMCYKGKGCKNLSWSERQTRAVAYWEKSYKGRTKAIPYASHGWKR